MLNVHSLFYYHILILYDWWLSFLFGISSLLDHFFFLCCCFYFTNSYTTSYVVPYIYVSLTFLFFFSRCHMTAYSIFSLLYGLHMFILCLLSCRFCVVTYYLFLFFFLDEWGHSSLLLWGCHILRYEILVCQWCTRASLPNHDHGPDKTTIVTSVTSVQARALIYIRLHKCKRNRTLTRRHPCT